MFEPFKPTGAFKGKADPKMKIILFQTNEFLSKEDILKNVGIQTVASTLASIVIFITKTDL